MRARVKDTIILWKTRCLGRTKDKRLVDAKLLRSQGRVKYLEGEVARLKQLTEPIGVGCSPWHVFHATEFSSRFIRRKRLNLLSQVYFCSQSSM